MTLRHLETFVKIGQLKSFTKAGEALHLTQPTISKQMMDLEKFFDIRLIDRTRRELALTRAGEILFKYAKDFLALQEETISAIAAFKGLKRGSVRIGASNIPGVYVLPPILKRFREQHDRVHLALTISDTKAILDHVEQGDLDIGFVGAKDENRKLLYHGFLDDLIVMVGSSAHPDSITMEELKGYPLVTREMGSGTRQSFEAALRKRGLQTSDFNVVAELGDTQAVKEAVKEGMGIAYLSRRAIADELSAKALKVLSVEGMPAIKRSFYMVLKKGRSHTPQVDALLKTIQEWKKHEKVRLASDQPWSDVVRSAGLSQGLS